MCIGIISITIQCKILKIIYNYTTSYKSTVVLLRILFINPTCGNTMIVNDYCAESKTLPDLHADLLKVFRCLWNGMSRMTSCWCSGVNLITIISHYFGRITLYHCHLYVHNDITMTTDTVYFSIIH